MGILLILEILGYFGQFSGFFFSIIGDFRDCRSILVILKVS